MKPYIAIDIETTGLNIDVCQILQIAALAVDENGTAVDTFNRYVFHQKIVGEAAALAMHVAILKNFANRNHHSHLSAEQAFKEFATFLKKHSDHNNQVTLAGKNIDGFDLPFLRAKDEFGALEHVKISHRVIDVGSLYLPDFGYVPSLGEINTLLGRGAVSHHALEDCMDVVAAIQHKLGEVK